MGKVYALASERSAGEGVDFKNRSIAVEDAAEFDFSKVQIGLFSPGARFLRNMRPLRLKQAVW